MFHTLLRLTYLEFLDASILYHPGDAMLRVCPAAHLHTIIHHLCTLSWQTVAISLQPALRKHLELLAQLIARKPSLIGYLQNLIHRLPDLCHDLVSKQSVHYAKRVIVRLRAIVPSMGSPMMALNYQP